MTAPDSPLPARRATVVLPRAAYLACSWTWCIGMYLPVLFIREFGWPGWFVFAIPNIFGAAMMGLMLRRTGASDAYVGANLPAMRWFSAATIAFHAFFLTWLSLRVLPSLVTPGRMGMFWAPALAIAMTVLGALGISRSFRWRTHVAVGMWIVSIGLLFAALRTGGAPLNTPAPPENLMGLAWVAPCVVFGFTLCPYLDLTFHRARAESPGREGDAAFLLGFGVLFLLMIAGTALYAGGILDQRRWSYYIIAHMALQSAFTIGAHARELRSHAAGKSVRRWISPAALLGIIAALVPYSGLTSGLHLTGEKVYLSFMGLYALAFPAYVWAAAPLRSSPNRGRALAVWAVACVLAAPLFWMGFVEHEWWCLGVGTLLALLARPVAFAVAKQAPRGL